uniref:Uncharacterized protein n=1 Tax=Pithovirus LCPAC403 TaxID=2506596 RepID=A0A481ZB28_9VIRU|nr:MAG: uncharacterized protein LCPAC403_02720 [Pithovirus LCPAC403]
MSISEEKLDLLELNESEEKLFIINRISLVTDPENWPEDSMPRLMYEGDRDAPEYVINNPKMKRKSIELVKSVIFRETEGPVLNLIDVDWNNVELTTRYLGLGVGIDFLYPLFLSPNDRAMWYDECKSRISHVCQYRPEDNADEDLLRMNLSDVITTNSPYITLNNLNLHPERLEKVRESEEKEVITDADQKKNDLIDEIVNTLSGVSDLLIVRDVALARFRGIKSFIKQSIGIKGFEPVRGAITIDVFAYGPDALEHIIEAVRLCLELSKKNFREYHRERGESEEITFMRVKGLLTPNRTRHKIIVPVTSINKTVLNVVFPLVRLHSKHDILTKIPLDCFAIGFDPRDPNMFYGLPRTYRSLDTMTNVVDPTRNGMRYLRMLNGVSIIGFDIAIPGFNIDDIDKLPCSDKILKVLNLARSAELLEERGKYVRPPSGTSTEIRQQMRQDNKKIRQSVYKIEDRITDMKLSGLVLLLAKIIHWGMHSFHHNRYSEFELAIEHQITPQSIRSIYKHPDRARVIFGDVLNQGEREFRITATRRDQGNIIIEDLKYTPLFPKIELLSFYLHSALYQVKTAFYEQYTCMEDINMPDDVDREDADVYEMLNTLSQRTL